MESGVLTIDQSTSATKVLLLDEQARIVRKVTRPHQQHYVGPGGVEQDAAGIWDDVRQAIKDITEDIPAGVLRGIGITNQRETVVAWDRASGQPVMPAMSWQDVRGQDICFRLTPFETDIMERTGLALSPYYSAAKLAYMLEQRPEIRERARAGDLCMGTMDAYLLARLTDNQVSATDVSNASRTQLMELTGTVWSDRLLEWFEIPRSALPETVRPSDAFFGELRYEGAPAALPIHAVLGDSHAALFAQGCLQAGDVKATYGTGSSVMMNTGFQPVRSASGLSTSVGFGYRGQVHYVLEGNVTCSGDTFRWLQDELGLISDIREVETLAGSVESTEGVYLVPAFSGLGAPYFRENARALLCGMSRGTTKAHVVRAALESVALLNADILEAMRGDSGLPVTVMKADGAPVQNRLLMQRQADYAGCPVRCSPFVDASAVGAGLMAGAGLGLYPDPQQLIDGMVSGAEMHPQITEEDRQEALRQWRQAVAKAMAD